MSSLKDLKSIKNNFDNMLFAYPENYERDKNILLKKYVSIFKINNDIPAFSELFDFIENYNIGVASDVAVNHYKCYSNEDCYNQIIEYEINQILLDLFGCDFYMKIYGIIEELNIVFVNDYEQSQGYQKVKEMDSCRIIVNSGKQECFSELSSQSSILDEDNSNEYLELIGENVESNNNK